MKTSAKYFNLVVGP